MNKKTFGLSFLLSTLVLSSAFGQNASPSANPKAASPSPSLQSTVAAPVVKIRIVVRSDEAAIRALVENSLRTELGKLKNVAVLSDSRASTLTTGGELVPADSRRQCAERSIEGWHTGQDGKFDPHDRTAWSSTRSACYHHESTAETRR